MPTTAVVLAGGLGTRLRSAVPDRPKVLALADGQPFLHYVLSYLAKQGIREVILSTGYLAEQVQAFAGQGAPWDLNISYSQEQEPLGTGGALRQACAGRPGPFFALNGDTLFTANLAELWQDHLKAGVEATVALLPVLHWWERGCVSLGPDGRIQGFHEKPSPARAGLNDAPVLVNGGVYVLHPAALETLPLGQAVSIERQVFPILAEQGRLAGSVQAGYFADIGTPESLEAFERDVRAGRLGF